MSTATEYDWLLSQRDELRQHIGGLFEDPPSKQRDALVSYLSGELQRISRLCQDSIFSKIVAVSPSAPVDTAATLPGSPAASPPSSTSASVPADQFISDEAAVAEAIRVEASLSSPGAFLYSVLAPCSRVSDPFMFFSIAPALSAVPSYMLSAAVLEELPPLPDCVPLLPSSPAIPLVIEIPDDPEVDELISETNEGIVVVSGEPFFLVVLVLYVSLLSLLLLVS